MIERFTEEEKVQVTNPMAMLNLVKTCSREKLDLALQDPSTLKIFKRYVSYEDKV